MDWFLDAASAESRAGLETLLAEHLRRRVPDLDDRSRSTIHRVLSDTVTDGAAAWVALESDRSNPELVIRLLPPGPARPSLSGPPAAPGVWVVDPESRQLAPTLLEAPVVSVTIPDPRPPEADIDIGPVDLPPDVAAEGFVATVATSLPSAVDAGLTTLEAAAACGVAGAGLAETAFRREAGAAPSGAGEVAQAFVRFVNRAGADFFVAEGEDRRAVVVNRRCPFGPSVAGRPTMCRISSAALGSLAARSSGRAQVVVDETIALGDPRCRLVVDLDPVETSPAGHLYHWPPSGYRQAGGPVTGRGFRVGLSLQLPRDRMSVPVVRHLVTRAMVEVGAAEEDAFDVELAVSEACGNVIEHSGPGDAYEVLVGIGPILAEIRVIDVGRGFDHVALSTKVARTSDERGRGIRLMHALVDQVRFDSAPETGTVVHLIKRLRFDEHSPVRRLMLAALADEDLESPGGPG